MRKLATAIGLSLAILLVVPLASETVVSYHRRYEASKLLAVVRRLRPAVTTQTQAQEQLKSFSRFEQVSDLRREGVAIHELDYEFLNGTNWSDSLAYHLRFVPFRLTLPWTRFVVNLEFVNGMLAEIDVGEMQVDQPGYLHPNGASVLIVSSQLGALPGNPWGSLDAGFNGYYEHSQQTAGLDEKGNFNGFTCCYERFIRLDDRASERQFSQSLNFQLRCLTSFLRCKNDREILP